MVGSSAFGQNDYGCRYGNRIFKILDIAHPSPTNFQYDSDGNGFPNGYSNLVNRCDDGSTTVCTIYNFNGTIRGTGILADHSMEYCPLDNYLFIGFGAIFVTFVFRRSLKPVPK